MNERKQDRPWRHVPTYGTLSCAGYQPNINTYTHVQKDKHVHTEHTSIHPCIDTSWELSTTSNQLFSFLSTQALFLLHIWGITHLSYLARTSYVCVFGGEVLSPLTSWDTFVQIPYPP